MNTTGLSKEEITRIEDIEIRGTSLARVMDDMLIAKGILVEVEINGRKYVEINA